MQKPENFENFYYKKVGLGEACGCAERAIDMYEFDRTAGKPKAASGRRRFSWKGFALKYGLLSRKKTPAE
ncbi:MULTISPECIES: hypothetical protein [unclassified Leisingera]|uniref:hypothetical protein n=1 Tax=unclassified Leisingera TaxID=2614906 RepID=UPI00057DBB68|nr:MULTISPECIES: hypothetical protein [unclassified Leisingera]KIC27649.1 hypothetical protein RA24_13160 [Leisingera sp. ANG-M6]KIC32689.1 hypothetical protein RA25_09190 [Leisingera sp. ANG-S5]